jgi:hypothetical protein
MDFSVFRRPASSNIGERLHRSLRASGPFKSLAREAGDMHFDQRTQAALREVGLDADDLQAASDAVVEATEETAADLVDFFEERDVVYSDMDMAHSASDYPEHAVDYLDLTTHADDMRGWLRFDMWGAYVEDGRVLEDDLVELSLGPTIHDRVLFADARERLE